MRGLTGKVRHLLVAQEGVTAIHFAVLLALIAIVWLTAMASISNGTAAAY